MKFTKYHGLGNDFILVQDFGGILVPRGEMLAQALCHRQFGIGADGLVLITKESDWYKMRIFNADGSEPEMCGNPFDAWQTICCKRVWPKDLDPH